MPVTFTRSALMLSLLLGFGQTQAGEAAPPSPSRPFRAFLTQR